MGGRRARLPPTTATSTTTVAAATAAVAALALGCAPLPCLSGSPRVFAPAGAYPDGAAFVHTEGGLVYGLQQEGGVRAYRGIPYAAAPIHAARWRAPAPRQPWGRSPWDNGSVLNATTYGSPCAQFGPAWPTLGGWPNYQSPHGTSSEDCARAPPRRPLAV